MEFLLSNHCKEQMILRDIPESIIYKVLNSSEDIIRQDECTLIFQYILSDETHKNYLYRIFVNICKQPNIVITVYRTSKIDKYNENKIR